MAGASSNHANVQPWAAPPTGTQACFLESRRMVRSGIDSSGALIGPPYIGAEQHRRAEALCRSAVSPKRSNELLCLLTLC
jgi:hypothetical protein